MSDTGYPERLGKDIAYAIEAVTKAGAIRVELEGETINNVRGVMDVSTDTGAPPKNPAKSRGKAKK